MKAIYLGAGCDIRPLKNYKNIKQFYYFDSQPYSEFGIKQSKEWNDGKWTGRFTNGFSRPNFIPTLNKTMKNYNMKLVNVSDNIRVYSNGDQTVYYHTNTAIPEHYEKIKNTIRNFDTLIVAGHDPDSIFLDATRKKIHFIGCENTSFHNDKNDSYGPENKNSVIYKMHNDNIQNKFKSFSYLKNNHLIHNFITWNEFYKSYLKDSRKIYAEKNCTPFL